MKHRKITAALVLAMCCAVLIGCSCIANTAEQGESMMNDLESSLLGQDSNRDTLLQDSDTQNSRLENSGTHNSGVNDSNIQDYEPYDSEILDDNDNGNGMVNDNGDASGADGTTNGINGDGSDTTDTDDTTDMTDNTDMTDSPDTTNTTGDVTGNARNSAQTTAQQQLTENEAVAIALNELGLSQSDINHLYVNLDYDDSLAAPYYEIDFTIGTTEYDFEINALDGTILEYQSDIG